MIPYLLAALAIWFVQTLIPSSVRYMSGGTGALAPNLKDALSGRDAPPAMPVMGARALRAQNNLLEALVVFIPVALLLEMQGQTGGWAVRGATVFLGARLLYVPAYMSGIPGVRSAIWATGHLGLAMMVLSLVGVLA